MAVGRAGYVGLVRVEGGALNVAAAIAPGFVRARGSAAASVAAILAEGGLPPLARIEESAWHGTLPLTRTSPVVAGHRLLLVGDAAGYVEPFTGEGMAWALAGACAAEPFALRGIANWDRTLEQAWTRAHRSLIARRQRWCRWLSALLRHPRMTRALLSVVARAPQLARPVVRELTAPLRAAKGVGE
jgi:flavin-dependent dehydrogenase